MMKIICALLLGACLLSACDRADNDPGLNIPAVSQLTLTDLEVGNAVELSWQNPTRGSITSIRIMRYAGSCVEDPFSSAAEEIFEVSFGQPGLEQTFRDEPGLGRTILPDGRPSCYAVYCKSATDYSAAQTVTGQSSDTAAPVALGNFEANPDILQGVGSIDLTWTKGEEDDLVVVVLRRAGSAVEGRGDPLAEELNLGGQFGGYIDFAISDGTEYHYLAWTEDEVPNRTEPQSASARRMVDDDADSFDEDSGDCDDSDDRVYPQAPALDCSATDWDCDGQGFEVDFCIETSPISDPGCLADDQQTTCDTDGCHWPILTCSWNGDSCYSGACYETGNCTLNSQGSWECWYPVDPSASDMIIIPAGPFMMGCNGALEDCSGPMQEQELPYHQVYLSAYAIDVAPVSVQQYQFCVNDSSCEPVGAGCYEGDPEYPILCVTWDQAAQYCSSVYKRLCTEAEWEKAARGEDGQLYPWGNEPATCDLAVLNEDGTGDPADDGCGEGAPAALYSRPANLSPFGVWDMAGNCWQWVSDWWQLDYYSTSPASDPLGPLSGTHKVSRGADYTADPARLVSSRRGVADPNILANIGIRCCMSLEPAQ